MLMTVGNEEEIKQSVQAFNQGLTENRELQSQLSYFRAWYYIPELNMVGPSKFIGYKGMTSDIYLGNRETDGRDTEPVLSRWFNILSTDTPEYSYVENMVEKLLSRYGKTLNRKARFNAPREWGLNQQSTTSERERAEAETISSEQRPIVEVFWRAYLSLYPEDQDILAQRILEQRRVAP
jgi:hypothetical protein